MPAVHVDARRAGPVAGRVGDRPHRRRLAGDERGEDLRLLLRRALRRERGDDDVGVDERARAAAAGRAPRPGSPRRARRCPTRCHHRGARARGWRTSPSCAASSEYRAGMVAAAVDELADARERERVGDEPLRRLAQQLLIRRQVEVHALLSARRSQAVEALGVLAEDERALVVGERLGGLLELGDEAGDLRVGVRVVGCPHDAVGADVLAVRGVREGLLVGVEADVALPLEDLRRQASSGTGSRTRRGGGRSARASARTSRPSPRGTPR